jgi:ribosomal protein L37AE/L43A
MGTPMYCPDCDETTEFQKIAGKWTCMDCGCTLDDEEESEELEDLEGEDSF